MSRKAIDNKKYTQINTNIDNFLIQNISGKSIKIVVSATSVSDDTEYDFILRNLESIGSMHVNGLIWVKAFNFGTNYEVSLVEG